MTSSSLAAALLTPFLLSLTAIAQQTELPSAPDAQWKKVQAISFGAPIIVRSESGHVTCRFKHAAPDAFSCIDSTEVDFRRSSIRRVETYNRAGSTAVLAAAGAGIGVVTVFIVSQAVGARGTAKASVFAGGAGMGAIMFFPIGYFAHPIHRTIYQAP